MLDNFILVHRRSGRNRNHSNETMDIDEVQYLSENELISVVPNFKHPEIHLIRGSVGPFLPLVPLQVPMWMVCHLIYLQLIV